MAKVIEKKLNNQFISLYSGLYLLAPRFCFSGTLNWGNDNEYDGGPSGLGLSDALIPISIFVACWWFALSDKSPIKSNFLLQIFFMFIAPGIFSVIAAKIIR